jgi:hypothetical protein
MSGPANGIYTISWLMIHTNRSIRSSLQGFPLGVVVLSDSKLGSSSLYRVDVVVPPAFFVGLDRRRSLVEMIR